MTLLALLSGVETVEVSGDTSMEISDIIYDSRIRSMWHLPG